MTRNSGVKTARLALLVGTSLITYWLVTGAACSAADTAAASNAPAAGYSRQSQVNGMISDALVLLRANRNEEAASELKRALEISPDSAEAHHNYGLALAKLGDMPAAIIELKTATGLKPDMDASWLTLAGLQQASGLMDDAIATYQVFLSRFKARTDLNDTLDKVSKLLDALQKESQRVKNDREQAEAISAPPQALLQTPAQAVPGADEYLADVLPHGRVTRWPAARMPLRVYIHDQSGLPSFKRWRDILIASFQDWSAASEARVTFKFTDDPNKENWDLDCLFVPNRAPDNDGLQNTSEAGEAVMYLNQNGITRGTIKLLTSSMSPVLPLTDNRMRTICLHEIGHALGLAGHTANPQDIMFYSTSFKDEWRLLSGRDAPRTIQHLYGSN